MACLYLSWLLLHDSHYMHSQTFDVPVRRIMGENKSQSLCMFDYAQWMYLATYYSTCMVLTSKLHACMADKKGNFSILWIWVSPPPKNVWNCRASHQLRDHFLGPALNLWHILHGDRLSSSGLKQLCHLIKYSSHPRVLFKALILLVKDYTQPYVHIH